MGSTSIDKKFLPYVATSMVTLFLQSAYSVVDGLFVSNLVGETALSAINVAWPIIAVVTALGTGIGCGGAVIMSTRQGEGGLPASNLARANVILFLLAASGACTVLFLFLLTPLLRLMGAEGQLLEQAAVYGRVMLAGSVCQILSCGLTPLLRNDNNNVAAMVLMVSGMVANGVLDYVCMAVFHLGIAGAALASVCAQALSAGGCLLLLLRKPDNPLRPGQLRLHLPLWKEIARTAVSPFGISLTPSLLILYHNIACLATGSDLAVNAYALITSTVGGFRMMLIGVAEGIQPLASYANGAKDYGAMRRIRNKGLCTAVAVSVLLFAFTVLTARWYPGLYGYTDQAAEAAYRAVMLTAPQLLFTGVVRVTSSFFYAVGKNRYSLFMIYFDPLLMTPAALYLLFRLLGEDGIWLNADITQLILNLAAAWMFLRHEGELRRQEARGSALASPQTERRHCL